MWRIALARAGESSGTTGAPQLEIQTGFFKSATYGQRLQVHTAVEACAAKTFRHRHIVQRGDELLCAGTEMRAFAMCKTEDPDRLKAIPVSDDIRALCD